MRWCRLRTKEGGIKTAVKKLTEKDLSKISGGAKKMEGELKEFILTCGRCGYTWYSTATEKIVKNVSMCANPSDKCHSRCITSPNIYWAYSEADTNKNILKK